MGPVVAIRSSMQIYVAFLNVPQCVTVSPDSSNLGFVIIHCKLFIEDWQPT